MLVKVMIMSLYRYHSVTVTALPLLTVGHRYRPFTTVTERYQPLLTVPDRNRILPLQALQALQAYIIFFIKL